MSHWTKENYRILLSNGDTRQTQGESNGLFALDSALTLTHLESGGKVAQFVEVEAAKRVGDYLLDNYTEEFTELGKAISKNPTAEEYKRLPEAIVLNRKFKADAYLFAQLAEFAVKDESRRISLTFLSIAEKSLFEPQFMESRISFFSAKSTLFCNFSL